MFVRIRAAKQSIAIQKMFVNIKIIINSLHYFRQSAIRLTEMHHPQFDAFQSHTNCHASLKNLNGQYIFHFQKTLVSLERSTR